MSDVSPRRRWRVLRRDGFTCRYCGARPPVARLEIDHIRPRARAVDNDWMNLITSCARCNSGKSAQPLTEAEIVAVTQHFPCIECQERRRREGSEFCPECDADIDAAVTRYRELQSG